MRSQLELDIQRQYELDRNHARGGRSFYFFDFDDNIAFLTTPIYLFHKDNGSEVALSSKDFAEASRSIGRAGIYKSYELRMDDGDGSFRAFRDRDISEVERVLGRKQSFIEDLLAALGMPDFNWKGPAWDCFYHAVFNKRPVSLITARGHEPETMKEGIRQMIESGHLPHEPNYLSLYPINHPKIRARLQKHPEASVAELKQAAIRASVERAFEAYGHNPYHRFGMSDDDPRNIELILEEMTRLKKDYPEVSFFVFDTHGGRIMKREIFATHTEDRPLARLDQLPLFQSESDTTFQQG